MNWIETINMFQSDMVTKTHLTVGSENIFFLYTFNRIHYYYFFGTPNFSKVHLFLSYIKYVEIMR